MRRKRDTTSGTSMSVLALRGSTPRPNHSNENLFRVGTLTSALETSFAPRPRNERSSSVSSSHSRPQQPGSMPGPQSATPSDKPTHSRSIAGLSLTHSKPSLLPRPISKLSRPIGLDAAALRAKSLALPTSKPFLFGSGGTPAFAPMTINIAMAAVEGSSSGVSSLIRCKCC
jgi:hypothetical protein